MYSAVQIDFAQAQVFARVRVFAWDLQVYSAVQIDFAQVAAPVLSNPRHYALDVNVCFYSLPLRGSFHKCNVKVT